MGAKVHRVLVVDDCPDTAEITAVLFELLGHETRRVVRSPDVVSTARAFGPDLIVLDVGLPGIDDGVAVVRALRAEPATRDRQIIAVSGWDRPDTIRRVEQAGVDAYFVKPIELRVIKDFIRRAEVRPVRAAG